MLRNDFSQTLERGYFLFLAKGCRKFYHSSFRIPLRAANRSSSTYTRLTQENAYCQLPPRVEHLLFYQSGQATELISSGLEIPPEYVDDLINFGAVFYSRNPPPPPDKASPSILMRYTEQLALLHKKIEKDGIDKSFLKKRGQIKSPKRLLSGDCIVEIGSYARVHVHPARFPRCYEVDWTTQVLELNDDFVVLDKPAGVPVGGTVDNLVESCLHFTAKTLGFTSPLRITHQLDTWTEGCLVLSQTAEFTSYFNTLLKSRKVSKIYRALTENPVHLGTMVHYMKPGRYPPKILSEEAKENWHRCELEVLDCYPVLVSRSSLLSETYKSQTKETSKVCFESVIRLVTGRTHQLRAQLAFTGSPLVGDVMYEPQDGLVSSGPSYVPSKVEPKDNVALQAWKLSWEGNEKTYEARTPWWRRIDV